MSSNNEEGWENEDYYSDNSQEFTWVMVLFALMSIIDCILVFSAIFGFYKEPSPILSLDNKIFKRIAIVSLIASSFVGCLIFIGWYIALDGNYSLALNFGAASIAVYALNMTLVIVLFGMRLIYTFKNTNYSMGNSFKYWLIAMTLIIALLCVYFFIAAIGLRDGPLTATGIALMVLFGTVNGIILLIIYSRKLTNVIHDFLAEFGGLSVGALNKLNRQLSDAYRAGETEVIVGRDADFAASDNNDSNINQNNNNSATGTDDNDNKSANKKGDKRSNEMFDLNRLISDMTRFNILIGVAMISTTISAILSVLFDIFGWRRIYLFIFILLDLLTNNICLVLQFKMSRKFYKKLCFLLINKCQQRQTKQINQALDEMNLLSKVSAARTPHGDIGFEIHGHGTNNNDETGNNDNDENTKYDNSSALSTMNSVQTRSDHTQ